MSSPSLSDLSFHSNVLPLRLKTLAIASSIGSTLSFSLWSEEEKATRSPVNVPAPVTEIGPANV